MAREISDFNGTVTAVSGTYPYGDIKDNPDGTKVDTVSNSDMHQLMQRLLDQGGITPNGLADNATNTFQLFEGLQGVVNSYAKQIIVSMFGQGYSSSEIYVLSGCETRADDGYVFYNGEIYAVVGNGGAACGGGLVDVVAIEAGAATEGLKRMNVVCAATGTGIQDFADLIYFNEWVDASGTTYTPDSGTFSAGTVACNKYLLRGNTVHYQLNITAVTVTGTPSSVTVSLPFLSSNIKSTPPSVSGVSGAGGALICNFSASDIEVSLLSGGTFSSSTVNFAVDVVFEIE